MCPLLAVFAKLAVANRVCQEDFFCQEPVGSFDEAHHLEVQLDLVIEQHLQDLAYISKCRERSLQKDAEIRWRTIQIWIAEGKGDLFDAASPHIRCRWRREL